MTVFNDEFRRCFRRIVVLSLSCAAILWTPAWVASAAEKHTDISKLAEKLRDLPMQVIPERDRETAAQMLPAHLNKRLQTTNARSTAQWKAIKTRRQWQRFRDKKVRLLSKTIGPFPQEPCDLHLQVVSTVKDEGFRIQNLIFQSRPGLWVPDPIHHSPR